MLRNTLLPWTKPGFIFQIILIGSGFHMMKTTTIFPETYDCMSEINDHNLMESPQIPPDTIPSQGIKWTGRYYSDNIISQIAALRDVGNHRRMVVHADDAGPHVSEWLFSRFTCATHIKIVV
jgi:hypothetical protein